MIDNLSTEEVQRLSFTGVKDFTGVNQGARLEIDTISMNMVTTLLFATKINDSLRLQV